MSRIYPIRLQMRQMHTGRNAACSISIITRPTRDSRHSYDVAVADGPFKLQGIKTQSPAPLTYRSSDENVAMVDAEGVVTPIGTGTAVITVTAESTGGYSEASIEITVNVSKPVQDIITSADSYTKTRLSKAFFMGAVAEGGGKLTYESTDSSVVKVHSSGRVTLMGPGTAEIIIHAEETDAFAAGEKRVPVKVKSMDEETYKAKFEKNKAGIEKTKVVSLKAYPETKRVKLTWKKSNSGYSVDYYQVWRSYKKSSGYTKIFTSSDADKKYFVQTKNVEPGTTYWYKVRGVRDLEGKLVYTPFTKIQVKTPN